MGVPLDWVKHLKTSEEQKEFETALRNSGYVLDVLKDILEEKLESVERVEMSSAFYDNPSWGYKQAHMNGTKAGISSVLKLLSFLDKG